MEKNKVLATIGRMYRTIWIYETETGYQILDANGKEFEFGSWSEACAFVDAWYAAQYVVSE